MVRYVNSFEDAAVLLNWANRICVIGSSGGGKSTLSQKLAKALHLTYVSLDRDVRWLPGWQERSRDEQRLRLSDLVAREAWVIDGSGSSSFDIRLPRTDLIIWLRLPRWKCLLGVAKRVARYKGTVRPDMAEGCPEPLPDRDFLSYIWNFERRFAPRIIQEIDRHGPSVPVITLKSHGEMAHLLDLAGLPH
ncbi:AAA family ATPase [Rhizobium sp. WL3]|uniref:AAA family ATPase n=1 Tax=Rhizobium sp. WL3 TaxID=2603277 RepID=UPI0011C1FE46|nr:AAA family ATPase [Rhizobium sp. WL3]QEE43823.1 AAA family ATPase [Rhizobium sp. WL3]